MFAMLADLVQTGKRKEKKEPPRTTHVLSRGATCRASSLRSSGSRAASSLSNPTPARKRQVNETKLEGASKDACMIFNLPTPACSGVCLSASAGPRTSNSKTNQKKRLPSRSF
ncbi:hypothetical protein MN608_04498 [Microdochium nivale]|nr:hypothetical protein MN608_04498 [Microdochium nivale]